MKKAICIFLAGIVVIAALALFVVLQIPVRKFEPATHTVLEEDAAYERAYNLYGLNGLKNRDMDNADVLNKQLYDVAVFCKTYRKSSYREYVYLP